MQKFKIKFNKQDITTLCKRINASRFPNLLNSETHLGVDNDYLSKLLKYWGSDYDWFYKENELNQYPQFLSTIDGLTIHFFHITSSRKNALPILLTHGWPDSFLRYAKIFPLLSDYNLIIPSLPGFAFSQLPQKGFSNNAETAEIWHKLMTEVLGYKNYIASGGDMGRGVTCYLATNHPDAVKGIHITDVGLVKELIYAPDNSLSAEEFDYKYRALNWLNKEGAYINIQSTKPQTLSYALSDSPIGMAAWMTEKYLSWSEKGLLSMDDICDSLTLYWLTNTAGSSIRAYYGNSYTLPVLNKINVPTAITLFPHDVLPAPRSWIEKNYPVMMYTEMTNGGHFTALEQPVNFANNLSCFANMIAENCF